MVRRFRVLFTQRVSPAFSWLYTGMLGANFSLHFFPFFTRAPQVCTHPHKIEHFLILTLMKRPNITLPRRCLDRTHPNNAPTPVLSFLCYLLEFGGLWWRSCCHQNFVVRGLFLNNNCNIRDFFLISAFLNTASLDLTFSSQSNLKGLGSSETKSASLFSLYPKFSDRSTYCEHIYNDIVCYLVVKLDFSEFFHLLLMLLYQSNTKFFLFISRILTLLTTLNSWII